MNKNDLPVQVLITGSRNWSSLSAIVDALGGFCNDYGTIPTGIVLISGACPTGADKLCEKFWEAHGGVVNRFPANWEKYGRRAGFVRNAEMVDLQPDICFAFIKDNSKGASMTRDLAVKKGISTITYTSSGTTPFWRIQ